MNRRTAAKILFGTALAGGGLIALQFLSPREEPPLPTAPKHRYYQIRFEPENLEHRALQNASDAVIQTYLDEHMQVAAPSHTQAVRFSRGFADLPKYIVSFLPGKNRPELEEIVRKQILDKPNDWFMTVQTPTIAVGDGQKRIAFASEKFLVGEYIRSPRDVESVIRHEDIHAKQMQLGYWTGSRYILGPEIENAKNRGTVREKVFAFGGEVEAYSEQIEEVLSARKTVTRAYFNFIARRLFYYLTKLAKIEITPQEAEYALFVRATYTPLMNELIEVRTELNKR